MCVTPSFLFSKSLVYTCMSKATERMNQLWWKSTAEGDKPIIFLWCLNCNGPLNSTQSSRENQTSVKRTRAALLKLVRSLPVSSGCILINIGKWLRADKRAFCVHEIGMLVLCPLNSASYYCLLYCIADLAVQLWGLEVLLIPLDTTSSTTGWEHWPRGAQLPACIR